MKLFILGPRGMQSYTAKATHCNVITQINSNEVTFADLEDSKFEHYNSD